MKYTKTEKCAGSLVGAQVAINRAVFELNSREHGRVPGHGPKPDDEYTLYCVLSAIEDLSKAAVVLQGVRGKKPTRNKNRRVYLG